MPIKSDILAAKSGGFPLDQTADGDRESTQEGGRYKEASLEGERQMKHPLQNTWTLWFFKNDRTKAWEDNQKAVVDFDTVEDFWSLFNHIEVASKLSHGCDYSLFKTGIKPMWEDKRNNQGGRWLINLDKRQRSTELDNFWLEVMLLMIGEAFDDHGKYVNGAVVSVRTKGDKMGIWLGINNKDEAITEIGKKIKHRLGIRVPISFEMHKDTMEKASSQTKVHLSV